MTQKALTEKIIDYLENTYAMEAANEDILTSLAATCADKNLAALLTAQSFKAKQHAKKLEELLNKYANGTSKRKILQTNMAALGKQAVDYLRTDKAGKATRDAYIIASMGQVSYRLLKNLADLEGLNELSELSAEFQTDYKELEKEVEQFWQAAIKADLKQMNDPKAKVLDYLENVHAMESNVLLMLTSVSKSIEDKDLKDYVLQRREKTKQQIEDLKHHLIRQGSRPSPRKLIQGYFFAIFKGPLNLIRTDRGGKDARDLLMVQGMQIAAYELLNQLAIATEMKTTELLAKDFLADEREFAAWVEKHVETFIGQDLENFMPTGVELPVIVYDDTCSLCNNSVGLVHKFDHLHKFNFMGYSRAVQEFPEVAQTDLDTGVQVRFANQTTTVGIDAVRSIMLRTPAGVIFGVLLFVPGVHYIANRIYQEVAKRRPRTCSIASHQHK